MYKIVNFSDSNTYTVKSLTGNVSNVVDKMIRLSAEITERFSSDIYYDIEALYKAVGRKEKMDRVLFFRLDGVSAYVPPLAFPYFGIDESIQAWRITHDPEDCMTVLKRVHVIRKESK